MTPFLAAVAQCFPGGDSTAGDRGRNPLPSMRPIHFLLLMILAPVICWPITWAICELHKLLHP